jgi:tetratricopeptide (TPR) repeat protein
MESLDDAIARAAQRTRSTPGDPGAWSVLAACLAAASRPELAAEAWGRVLALDPRSVAGLCGLAQASAALGRTDEAASLFDRALALDPGSFDAGFGLALLAFNAGDLGRAEVLIGGLGEDRPGVLWLAARINAARGDLEQARSMIERLLRRPDLGAESRAEALLLRAQVLDRQGLARPAFAAASEGKAIQRRLFAARAAAHEGEIQKFRRLAAWFSAADNNAWAQAPVEAASDVAGHVFLVGFPRSGTTLLEQALAGHPGVIALEEAPTLAKHYHAFLKSADGLERLARISAPEADVWRARYWDVVRAHGVQPAGRVFLDKAPAETLSLPVIGKLFPTAKILFAVRDPRDVVVSCFLNGFQMNAMTYAFTSLADTAACYAACMELAQVYRWRLTLDLREVRYQALIDDFTGELADICAFIDLEFEPAMADVAATAARRVVRTPSAAHVRSGVDRRGLARWPAYAAELAPILPVLEPWVDALGYAERQPSSAGPSAAFRGPSQGS